ASRADHRDRGNQDRGGEPRGARPDAGRGYQAGARRGRRAVSRLSGRLEGGGDTAAMRTGSEVYLHGHHDSVLRSHRWRTAENSARYPLEYLVADAGILDVGCGPGTITAGLAALVPDGRVVGIDAAAGVLAEARAAAARLGLANVRYEVGDVYQLAFADC